jgi:hypothetical protein
MKDPIAKPVTVYLPEEAEREWAKHPKKYDLDVLLRLLQKLSRRAREAADEKEER